MQEPMRFDVTAVHLFLIWTLWLLLLKMMHISDAYQRLNLKDPWKAVFVLHPSFCILKDGTSVFVMSSSHPQSFAHISVHEKELAVKNLVFNAEEDFRLEASEELI